MDSDGQSRVPVRRFGRTGLMMPVFSCGGMRYQQTWGDEGWEVVEEENQRNVEATIDRALALGIRHIETARGYGTSELQLGRGLASRPRDSFILQTKVGPRADGDEFREVVETSLRKLGVDRVDLLGVHGVNLPEHLDMCTRAGGTLAAARQLKAEGVIDHIGFSTHGLPSLVQQVVETGEFDYVNLHWYYVNQEMEKVIEAARRHDMGVFIISPNDKGGMLYAPSEKLRSLCEPLHPMQFNDLFCLCREDVHTLSLGAATPSDFDLHVEGMVHYARRREVVGEIDERIRQAMADALGADWWANWWRGLPDYTEVPGGVNVEATLRLWNWAVGMDMLEYARNRYNMMGSAGHWVPGVQAADVDAEALAPLLRENPFRDRIPALLQEAHALLAEAPKKRISESEE